MQNKFFFLALALSAGAIYFFTPDPTNAAFFSLAFLWHYTVCFHRESLPSRFDRLFQLFLNYPAAYIRPIVPIIIILLLYAIGGSGNILYALAGSALFELLFRRSGRR